MPDAATGTQSTAMPVKDAPAPSSKSPETPEAQPQGTDHLDTKPRKDDVVQRSMDGQRIIVHRTDKDGNDASFVRGATLAEQAEHLVDSIEYAMIGSVPGANAADVEVSGEGDDVTVTVKLSADPKKFLDDDKTTAKKKSK